MGTRSYADVAPTASTIALNAFIFGYAGHSLVTPHTALKQSWWTTQRIDAKVDRDFVLSKFRGEERGFLDQPLAFGEGLTDDTYMEWILARAKRLFLILTEVAAPDQIFGCIDDSWADDDLPLSRENVRHLELSYENNEELNRRFYDMQFLYLLRELEEGEHVDYGPKEHIPMEYANTLPPAVALQTWDRVHFPGRPNDVFMRRKYALVDKATGRKHRRSFTRHVCKAQALGHEHIANAWATYTSNDAGYVLSSFVGEHTLGTFINHRTPTQFICVPLAERPVLLCEWMHCLADALASLHHRGVPHTCIRPSNILVDQNNRIAFADVGSLRTFQRGKRMNKSEVYDYAAPESQVSQTPLYMVNSPPSSALSAFGRSRKMSTSTGSSSSSGDASSTRSNSVSVATTTPQMHTPPTPPSSGRSNSIATVSSAASPETSPISGCVSQAENATSPSSITFRPVSGHHSQASPRRTMFGQPGLFSRSSFPDPDIIDSLPEFSPVMADIFSLACVYLDIITFLLQGKLNDFVKFRTTKLSGRGTSIANPKYDPSPTKGAPAVKSPPYNFSKTNSRPDSSFHHSADKLETWIQLLKEESVIKSAQYDPNAPTPKSKKKRSRVPEQDPAPRELNIMDAMPALLSLVQQMLDHDPSARPTAIEVRNRIAEILHTTGGVSKTLCCQNRTWDLGPMPSTLFELGDNDDEDDDGDDEVEEQSQVGSTDDNVTIRDRVCRPDSTPQSPSTPLSDTNRMQRRSRLLRDSMVASPPAGRILSTTTMTTPTVNVGQGTASESPATGGADSNEGEPSVTTSISNGGSGSVHVTGDRKDPSSENVLTKLGALHTKSSVADMGSKANGEGEGGVDQGRTRNDSSAASTKTAKSRTAAWKRAFGRKTG